MTVLGYNPVFVHFITVIEEEEKEKDADCCGQTIIDVCKKLKPSLSLTAITVTINLLYQTITGVRALTGVYYNSLLRRCT